MSLGAAMGRFFLFFDSAFFPLSSTEEEVESRRKQWKKKNSTSTSTPTVANVKPEKEKPLSLSLSRSSRSRLRRGSLRSRLGPFGAFFRSSEARGDGRLGRGKVVEGQRRALKEA